MDFLGELGSLCLILAAAKLGYGRRDKPKRPGYIDHRPGFGRGINHPTFIEVRRGMRAARRMRRR